MNTTEQCKYVLLLLFHIVCEVELIIPSLPGIDLFSNICIFSSDTVHSPVIQSIVPSALYSAWGDKSSACNSGTYLIGSFLGNGTLNGGVNIPTMVSFKLPVWV